MLTRVDVHIQWRQSGLPIDRDFQLLRLHGHRPVRLRIRRIRHIGFVCGQRCRQRQALLPQSLQPLHGGLACRTVMPHGRQLTQRVKKTGGQHQHPQGLAQTQRLAPSTKRQIAQQMEADIHGHHGHAQSRK